MPVWPSRGFWSSLNFRGFLWIAVGTVFILSFLLYSPDSTTAGAQPGPMDWLFRSWPSLFAAAGAMWLLLAGPALAAPSWIQKNCRVILVFFVYSGFLHLLQWAPFWTMMQSLGFTSKNKETGVLILVATMVWMIATVRVVVSGGLRLPAFGLRTRLARPTAPQMTTTRPTVRFADVGGLEETKSQIRQLIETRLKPGKFSEYGVIRNGILLHGPRGSGKTFLAEATAGEFGLNYFYVSPTQLTSMWVGGTENNLRSIFSKACSHKPVLFFIDEIDTLAAARVNIRQAGDLGGSNRGYNDAVIQLMQCIDQYRAQQGVIIM